jgi:hypothetical protein
MHVYSVVNSTQQATFLISNFRRVVSDTCFIVGDLPAFDIYMLQTPVNRQKESVRVQATC